MSLFTPLSRSLGLLVLFGISAQGGANELHIENWADTPLPVASEGEADIADFAATLSQAFAENKHCAAAFARYQGAGEASNIDGNNILINQKSAYARCENEANAYLGEYTYWKRNNGHYLLAMAVSWNDITWEGDTLHHSVHFYDIDPKAKPPVLTPERALSDNIQAFHHQGYTIKLPQSGTALILQRMGESEKSYLNWDGENFARQPGKQANISQATAGGGKSKQAASNKPAAAQKTDKPPAVADIAKLFRDAKEKVAKSRSNTSVHIKRTMADIARNTPPDSVTKTIEYLFSATDGSLRLIYVTTQSDEMHSYEEFLVGDTEGDKVPELRFWFQKISGEGNAEENRLYFENGDIVYYDIRIEGQARQSGTKMPPDTNFNSFHEFQMKKNFEHYYDILTHY